MTVPIIPPPATTAVVGDLLPTNYSDVAKFDPNSSDIDKKLIYEKSDAGQEYRKSMLRNRAIVLVTIGDMSRLHKYKYMLDELGLYLFVVEEEGNPTVVELQKHHNVTAVLLPSLRSKEIIEDICMGLRRVARDFIKSGRISEINQTGNSVKGLYSGCYTMYCYTVGLVPRVREIMGFCGDECHIVDLCHDKYKSREIVNSAGLPGPVCRLIRNQADVNKYVYELRYPIVLKPLNSAGSMGVTKIHSPAEFLYLYEIIRDNYKRLLETQDEDLMGVVLDDTTTSLVRTNDGLCWFSAEEWIDGDEFDIDVIMQDGLVTYAQVQQDWDWVPPHMVERGNHSPPDIGLEEVEKLRRGAEDCVRALGCHTGAYHVEMCNNQAPVMIEVNPRMGGHTTWDQHRATYNVDLIMEVALVHCRIPSAPMAKVPDATAVTVVLYAPWSGKLRTSVAEYNNGVYKELLASGYVQSCTLSMSISSVSGWSDSDAYPTEIGIIQLKIPMTDMSIKEAKKYGNNLRQRIIVPYLDGDDGIDSLGL